MMSSIPFLLCSVLTISLITSSTSTFVKASNRSTLTVFQHHKIVRPLETIPQQKLIQSRRHGEIFCGTYAPTVELALVYDATLCDQFDNDQSRVEAFATDLVLEAEKQLRPRTCVRLNIAFHASNCKPGGVHSHSVIDLPQPDTKCSSDRNDCSRSSDILNALRDAWSLRKLVQWDRYDVVLLISGAEDGTQVAGAAFGNSVCDNHFGYAWIETTHNRVDVVSTLAHEMAHLLGALHDADGLMRQVIAPGEVHQLSNRSASLIRAFMKNDRNAWCLFRSSENDEKRWEQDKWSKIEALIPSEPILDIAATKGGLHIPQKIFLLSQSARSVRYSVLSTEPCGKGCEKPITSMNSYQGPPSCLGCSFGSLALYKSPTTSDTGVIIAHVIRMVPELPSARYHISQPDKSKGSGHMSWSTPLTIPNWPKNQVLAPLKQPDTPIFAIATGGISNAASMDLIWMYIDDYERRKVVRYRVGFSLDRRGKALGGWGDDIQVPGWFGEQQTFLRASLHDIGGNGKLDLVVFYGDATQRTMATFYRVGRDLDVNGKVTRGWSQFMRIPMQSPTIDGRFSGGGIEVTEWKSGVPRVIVPLSNHFSKKTELIYSEKSLQHLRFTSEKYWGFTRDVSWRCYVCYIGSSANQCADNVKVCAAWMDEVRLEKKSIPQALKMARTGNYFRGLPRSHLISDHMACAGFDHMYKNARNNRDGCDLTDFYKVMRNGLLVSFEYALKKEGKGKYEIEKSWNNFIFNGATSGRGSQSTSVNVQVIAKNGGTYEVIRRALKVMQRRHSDFNDIFKENPQVQSTGKGRYLVSFLYKPYSGEFV